MMSIWSVSRTPSRHCTLYKLLQSVVCPILFGLFLDFFWTLKSKLQVFPISNLRLLSYEARKGYVVVSSVSQNGCAIYFMKRNTLLPQCFGVQYSCLIFLLCNFGPKVCLIGILIQYSGLSVFSCKSVYVFKMLQKFCLNDTQYLCWMLTKYSFSLKLRRKQITGLWNSLSQVMLLIFVPLPMGKNVSPQKKCS